MQEFSEKVLVLHVGRFRESDAWVRLFSPSRGVYTAFAFGGCRSRKRFCGCLDSLNEVLFRVKGNRHGTYLCLEEGVLVRSWQSLRHDNKLLGLAVNCIKFTEALLSQPDSCQEAYQLLSETMDVLDAGGPGCLEQPRESWLQNVPTLFRAALAFSQGYAPRLETCARCGDSLEKPGARFQVEQGYMLCANCAPRDSGMRLPVSPETLGVARMLGNTAPSRWAGMPLTDTARRELAIMVDHFVRYHLGLAWDRGRFRQV